MKSRLNSSGIKYIFAGVLCLILLATIAIPKVYINMTGETILVKTRAVDPRDLFRGDYVTLSLDIDQIQGTQISNDISNDIYMEYTSKNNYYNQIIWVNLVEGDQGYEPSGISIIKPNEGIYLKAEIKSITFDEANQSVKEMRVEYFIDRYFVEENTGKDLEDMIRSGDAYAMLKVKNGEAIIVEIVSTK